MNNVAFALILFTIFGATVCPSASKATKSNNATQIKVQQGETIILNCTFNATQECMWTHNDQPICIQKQYIFLHNKDSNSTCTIINDECSIQITEVDTERDVGNWRCKQSGTDDSQPDNLVEYVLSSQVGKNTTDSGESPYSLLIYLAIGIGGGVFIILVIILYCIMKYKKAVKKAHSQTATENGKPTSHDVTTSSDVTLDSSAIQQQLVTIRKSPLPLTSRNYTNDAAKRQSLSMGCLNYNGVHQQEPIYGYTNYDNRYTSNPLLNKTTGSYTNYHSRQNLYDDVITMSKSAGPYQVVPTSYQTYPETSCAGLKQDRVTNNQAIYSNAPETKGEVIYSQVVITPKKTARKQQF